MRQSWISSVSRTPVLSHTVRQQHDRSWTQGSPMLVHKYMDQNCSATMLAAKKLRGVTPEADLRIPLHAGDKAHK